MHCVDLGESFPTHSYLQNLASIQPRTSPLKFAGSLRSQGPEEPTVDADLLGDLAGDVADFMRAARQAPLGTAGAPALKGAAGKFASSVSKLCQNVG